MADGLKKFGDKVRAKLQSLDRNQAWLSEKMETSPSQLSKWLNEGNQPGHPYLLRMSDILGTTINFLIDDRIDEEPRAPAIGDDLDSQMILRFLSLLGPEEIVRRIVDAEKGRAGSGSGTPKPIFKDETYGEKKNPPGHPGKGRKAGNGN